MTNQSPVFWREISWQKYFHIKSKPIMPLVLDEEFSKKLLKKMFALLAIFFRILEPFDLNTSFVHEMDLFFIYPNCIHKNSYFSPLCTVYNIAWRVYSIHSPPWVWGGKNWPEQHNIHPGAAHKKLDLYFLSWKKIYTHHAIIHHFRIFTCFVNFFADLFIMLYYY